jgi:hypothetical protein
MPFFITYRRNTSFCQAKNVSDSTKSYMGHPIFGKTGRVDSLGWVDSAQNAS